jgi:anti-sigma regulatory factor (Ser/Thr protein kinase)
MSVAFSIRLDRDLAAAAEARREVKTRLGEELPADKLADVVLTVSELVTNAVLHGQGDIRLRLEQDPTEVRGEVIDDGGGLEYQLQEEGIDEVRGRGLLIVGRLAAEWGVHEGTTHVWFRIPLAGQSTEPRFERPELAPPDDPPRPDA